MIKDQTGSTLRPIPWMVKKGLVKVAQVTNHSGVGMKRDQWFQFYDLRQCIPNLLPCDNPKFTLIQQPDKDADKASFKELETGYWAGVGEGSGEMALSANLATAADAATASLLTRQKPR